MRILAIDPGIANTGVVALDYDGTAEAFAFAGTLKTASTGYHPEFTDVYDRAAEIATELAALCERLCPDFIVAESYKDYGGQHLRGARLRWTTPLLCGVLAARLGTSANPVIWQDPEHVMKATAHVRDHWKHRGPGLIEGDAQITNDHLRSAAGHALYARTALWNRIREVRP